MSILLSFFVYNVKQLIDVYNTIGSSVLAGQTVTQEKVSSYGIVVSEARNKERIFKVNEIVKKYAVAEAPIRLAVLVSIR